MSIAALLECTLAVTSYVLLLGGTVIGVQGRRRLGAAVLAASSVCAWIAVGIYPLPEVFLLLLSMVGVLAADASVQVAFHWRERLTALRQTRRLRGRLGRDDTGQVGR